MRERILCVYCKRILCVVSQPPLSCPTYTLKYFPIRNVEGLSDSEPSLGAKKMSCRIPNPEH